MTIECNVKEISTLKNKHSVIAYEMFPDRCKFKWAKQRCEISKDDIDRILKDFFTNENEWYLLDANVSKQRGGLGTYILNDVKGLSQRHASSVAAIMENEGLIEFRINGRNVELKKCKEESERYLAESTHSFRKMNNIQNNMSARNISEVLNHK